MSLWRSRGRGTTVPDGIPGRSTTREVIPSPVSMGLESLVLWVSSLSKELEQRPEWDPPPVPLLGEESVDRSRLQRKTQELGLGPYDGARY